MFHTFGVSTTFSFTLNSSRKTFRITRSLILKSMLEGTFFVKHTSFHHIFLNTRTRAIWFEAYLMIQIWSRFYTIRFGFKLHMYEVSYSRAPGFSNQNVQLFAVPPKSCILWSFFFRLEASIMCINLYLGNKRPQVNTVETKFHWLRNIYPRNFLFLTTWDVYFSELVQNLWSSYYVKAELFLMHSFRNSYEKYIFLPNFTNSNLDLKGQY